MTPKMGGRFWKKHFFTQLAVVHSDPSSSHVWLMVGGGALGWREDQHIWDGQGLKDPCFFETFLESQNHREKLNL